MRIVTAAVIVAFLAAPAFAQSQKPVPRYGETDKAKTPQELQADREAEQAYKRALGNIPEQKATDPWGNVRSDNSPKPDSKASAAKKTKTGTTN